MNNRPDEVAFIHEPPKPLNPDNPYSLNLYRQGTHERYGPIILSIQAGYGNYADPRDTYLPNLADYKSVEIAMFDLRYESNPLPWDKREPPFRSLGAWTNPHRVGLIDFDELLSGDDVEGWVEWDEINRLREALAALYGGRDDDRFSLAMHGRDANGYTSDEYDVFLKAGPDAVELYRQHGEGHSEVVGNFQVGEELAEWQKDILDKFRQAVDESDHEGHDGWGTNGWSNKEWD